MFDFKLILLKKIIKMKILKEYIYIEFKNPTLFTNESFPSWLTSKVTWAIDNVAALAVYCTFFGAIIPIRSIWTCYNNYLEWKIKIT